MAKEETIITSRSFRDLNISFRNNPVTKDLLVTKDESAITQAISNLVQTRFGEKLMSPDIGSDVYDMLFEPLDVFSAITIKDAVINTIRNYEPRVEVIEVRVIPTEDDEVLLTLIYRIIGEPNIIQNQFILERPSS